MPQDSLGSPSVPQLTVPTPWVARHPDTITRPGELNSWLGDLPMADPVTYADQLYRQLRMLVRDPTPDAQFPKLLACFHEPVRDLEQQVWQGLRSNHFNKTQLALRQSLSELLFEIANGHMRRINQFIAAALPPEPADLVDAMLPLTRLIQWDILQYNLTRPALWKLILQLYRLSELYALTGHSANSTLSQENDARDVHGNFHTALILLLCDPYRLPRGMLQCLVLSLPQASRYLRTLVEPIGHHCIPVSLSGKVPPLRLARQPQLARAANHLCMDEFLAQLEHQGLSCDSDGSLATWLGNELRLLSHHPDSADGRRQQRHPRQADYHFQVGLSSVHQRLQDIQRGQVESDSEDIEMGAGVNLGGPSLGLPCEQVDQSRDGALFRLHQSIKPPDIGEVLLFEADADQAGSVGFVARVRRHLRRDDGRHDIGVEKLRGNVIPVGLGDLRRPALLHADQERHSLQLLAAGDNTEVRNSARHTLHGVYKSYQVKVSEQLESASLVRLGVRLVK